MTKDLTRGNPTRIIVQFAVPIFLGLLLQQMYNLVDTMIVGKFVGLDALGGVGSTGALNFLVLGSCTGLCMGFGIPAANAFGAGDSRQLRRYVAGSIYLSCVAAALVMAVVLVFCREILTAMHTTPETYEYAYDYIYRIFWGIPFVMLYNMTAAMIRAVGDSKSPVIFLAIAAALNVALDLTFILIFDMGVAGAAWATVLSQGISGGLCVVYIAKKLPIFRFQRGEMAVRLRELKVLLANGVPMAVQYSITAVGSIMLQSAINSLGTTYVNALATGNKINAMLCCPTDALGTAMATYCSQNLGARRIARIRQGLRVATVFSVLYSLAYMVVAWSCTGVIAMLFLQQPDEALIALIRQYLMCMGLFGWSLGLVNGFRFSIQGMGYSRLAIISGIMEMIARTLTALLLVPQLGYLGACLGSPLAWVMADFFLLPTAYWCVGALRRRIPQDVPEELPQGELRPAVQRL